MTLVPTTILKAIEKVSKDSAFRKYEGRLSTYGALDAFIANTSKLVPKTQLERAKKAPSHVVEIPVMKAYDSTLITERACEFTPDAVETDLFPLTWKTVGFMINEYPAGVYVENYFTKEEHFEFQLRQGLRAVLADIEGDIVAFLEANKSESNASPFYGAMVGDAKIVPNAQAKRFYARIEAIMGRNDLPQSGVIDITNTESVIEYEFIGAQGSANSANTAYQIRAVVPYRTNRITPSEGVDEIHYLIADGGVGMLTWNSYDFRVGTNVSSAEVFTQVADPIYGFTWDVKINKECVDVSETYAGHTAGVQTQYAFWVDYALLTSYLSEEGDSVIFKYIIESEDVGGE